MKNIQWPEGIKKTRQREAIWSILTTAKRPVTAVDIADRIGEGTTWMSTIYRTLELLETKGIITRTTIMGSDMAYYEITPHTHRHYAVCTSCGTMIPLHTCPVVEMPQELTEAGFTVTEHHLEIAGLCKKCNNKK
ncbi:Fur family transcriptional regulator [Veillonella rodentium]|uniref:Zinc-specific metallo-regulatory protein n=1 Tax=Veillonella rodentium TaxID=248315 RepID=A0A239YFH4_9FIRM|nr:Fur family transcriptional regulator [Veillonella rodentium]SNV56964.1 Zinc-specific metallo-regulatory protein [Veillonella rodentium]